MLHKLTPTDLKLFNPLLERVATQILECPAENILNPSIALRFAGNMMCLSKGIRNKKSIKSIKQFFMENTEDLNAALGVTAIVHFVFKSCPDSV